MESNGWLLSTPSVLAKKNLLALSKNLAKSGQIINDAERWFDSLQLRTCAILLDSIITYLWHWKA
jgi:hypothetical protein